MATKTPKLGKKAAKSTTSLVTFLLDKSYSMLACKEATIGAFNTYLKGLQEDKGDGFNCLFTFLQFDTVSIEKICVAEPVAKVAPLNNATYQPRGGTPLIEACIKTIKAVEEALTKRDDKPKVVVCFQTDGEENSSGPEYTSAALKALIEAKTKEGWEFVFMGAGINAYHMSQAYGVSINNTMSYDHTQTGTTMDAFMATAHNTRSYLTGNAMSASYSVGQRLKAGDAFAAKAGVTVTTKAKDDLDLSK